MINQQSIQMGIAYVRSVMNYIMRWDRPNEEPHALYRRPTLVKQHTIGPNTRINVFLGI